MMEVPTPSHSENLDVSDATFVRRDLTTCGRLDELGPLVVGQHLDPTVPCLRAARWLGVSASTGQRHLRAVLDRQQFATRFRR